VDTVECLGDAARGARECAEKVEQGWRQMREDRAAFVAFFGGDELALPPGEAGERLNAARSNLRFHDRRIADLEAQILNTPQK